MLVLKFTQLPQVEKIPKLIAFDTETHPDGKCEGFSFAYLEGKKIKSYYVPLTHDDIPEPYENIDWDKTVSYLNRLLNKRSVIMQNAQFDLNVIQDNFKIKIPYEYVEDTMLMHYTLDTERYHGLKEIMFYEYGFEVTKYEEAKAKGFNFFVKYADYDSRYTLFLYYKLLPLLKKQKKSYALYRNYEVPFIEVLRCMNHYKNFVRVNEPLLFNYKEMITDELITIKTLICEKLNIENPSSPKQLGEALEKVGGYTVNRTKKGNYSTGEKEILALYKKKKGMILSALLYYRAIYKQENTYIRPLYNRLKNMGKNVYVITGYDFSHIGTRHGRMSAYNPNLQNQTRDKVYMKLQLLSFFKAMGETKKDYMLDSEFKTFIEKMQKKDKSYIDLIDKYSIDIRKVIIPMPGRVFIGADYSQIELRMMAHLSNDEKMIDAFRQGKDIHQSTADEINALLKGDFKIDRQGAKSFNFGLIYGLYYTTIAGNLGIPMKRAKAFYESYFNLYSGVKEFIKRVHSSGRKSHFVQTILGRRRNVDTLGINIRENTNEAFKRRKYAENASVSTIVSGSSADLIKIAMINIYKKYKDVLDVKIQVHDELIFEVDEKLADKYSKIVKQEMEGAMELSVPVVADVKVGTTWRAVH